MQILNNFNYRYKQRYKQIKLWEYSALIYCKTIEILGDKSLPLKVILATEVCLKISGCSLVGRKSMLIASLGGETETPWDRFKIFSFHLHVIPCNITRFFFHYVIRSFTFTNNASLISTSKLI